MKKIFSLFIFTFFTLTTQRIDAQEDIYPFANKTQATQFQQLTNEIRCVVCQNQSIADSNAPLANDLRNKIYTLINADWSNQQIKAYLRERYGDFILLNPPLNPFTFILWGFPFLSLLIACFMLIHAINKKRNKRVGQCDGHQKT